MVGPLPVPLGRMDIVPVMDAQTLARQNAMTAITNITNTVADLLAILTP